MRTQVEWTCRGCGRTFVDGTGQPVDQGGYICPECKGGGKRMTYEQAVAKMKSQVAELEAVLTGVPAQDEEPIELRLTRVAQAVRKQDLALLEELRGAEPSALVFAECNGEGIREATPCRAVRGRLYGEGHNHFGVVYAIGPDDNLEANNWAGTACGASVGERWEIRPDEFNDDPVTCPECKSLVRQISEMGFAPVLREAVQRAVHDLGVEIEALGGECSINLASIRRGLQMVLGQTADPAVVAEKLPDDTPAPFLNGFSMDLAGEVLLALGSAMNADEVLDRLYRNTVGVWEAAIKVPAGPPLGFHLRYMDWDGRGWGSVP